VTVPVQIDLYVKREGQMCPGCECQACVPRSKAEVDIAEVTQDMYCMACGARWQDVYALTKYRYFEPGKRQS